ncbi:MAG: glycine--tRNA ligase, partial [Patescibacteria group bacterium]
PGSEIYGGLANSWDYGPLGAELKRNIKNEWWKMFVQQRSDVVGLDAALIMNPKVWEASGHLQNFTDPLVECKKCHQRFRSDQIQGSPSTGSGTNGSRAAKDDSSRAKSRDDLSCPECGGELTKAKQFNLMFKTFLGPTEDAANTVYLRPETAQAMFVDFKLVTETTRKRLPFGIAQTGKAFRNEITPGNFIFRTREFEQMEIEYFIEEKDWKKHFDNWLEEMGRWMEHLGISKKKIHYREIPKDERAHYSQRTVDIDYEFPFGKSELYGLAYRGDFDLKNHQEKSGQDLTYTDPEDPKNKFLPHVIEPTWGVDRSVLAAMLEAYNEEDAPTSEKDESEQRTVMKFPFWLAPIKVAILPLSKKEELAKIARPVYEELAKKFVCEYDETQSIGRRYRRQDEIGTPFCVTVDFETEKDKSVTVRDRDSMKQIRVETAKLTEVLEKSLSGEKFEKLGKIVK